MMIIKKHLEKIFIFTVIFALLLVFLPYSSKADESEEWIKVGLYYGDTGVYSCDITSERGFIVYDTDFNEIERTEETIITLTPYSDFEGRIIMPITEEGEDRIFTIGGNQYRDGVMVITSEKLTIINYVTMEHYLMGVVSREMSTAYPIEALKAQAVCARSFAACCTKHKGQGFDVCKTTCCQAYGGVASEHSAATQACLETAGLKIYYEGSVVSPYYSSNSAGYTTSCKDMWDKDLGYCQSVLDPYTDRYDWATMYTFDEIRQRLLDAGYDDVGNIQSVKVNTRTETGYVYQIYIQGDIGGTTLTRSNIMGVLKLKSNYFSMAADSENAVVGQGSGAVSYYVISADGTYKVPATELYVYNGTETVQMPVTEPETEVYTYYDEVVTGGTMYLAGVGYGHGVGMSQNGAKNMANQGFTFDEILNFYFTDIEINQ